MKVVFFATPDIAINSFNYFLNNENFEILALVTQPTKPTGRGKKLVDKKIKTIALDNNIQVFEPHRISKEPDIIEALKKLEPDFFITFAFGQLLSQEVIDIPKFATINLHASLLPKYRGANPICEPILNGDKKTGITTMKTVLAMDAGDICLQQEIELNDEINDIELTNIISEISPKLLDETLTKIYNNELASIPQNHDEATHTKKIKKEDKIIDFNQDAKKLHDKIRSMVGSNTNHFIFNSKVIKVIKTKVQNDNSNAKAGEVLNVNKDYISIKCQTNAINLLTLKPEGKNEMSAYNWSLGSKIQKGDIIKCIQEE